MTGVRLEVASGTGAGVLARRADALLFISGSGPAPTTGLIGVVDAFLRADGADAARDVVTAAVVDAGFSVEPFLLIGWNASVHVLALGDVELTSDLPTLAMLSGRGSSSWVEHRPPRLPARCQLRSGPSPMPGSDLVAGCIPADGFLLHLDFSVTDQSLPGARSIATSPSAPPAAPQAVSPVPASAHHHADGWAALEAAVGGDWMEDSLGLPAGSTSPPTAAGASVPAVPATSGDMADDSDDSELTLDPASFLGVASSLPPPTGSILQASDEGPPTSAILSRDLRKMVQVRRCHRQHVNPPTAALCRQCREPIDPRGVVELVAQPALGSLVLPDDATLPIDGSIVLGRNPDPGSARITEPAVTQALEVGSDVSRTHLVVRATGWTMEAIDCASSGRTVLVPGNGTDPVELQPWVPHELMPGDTLYLGGPTQVRVIA